MSVLHLVSTLADLLVALLVGAAVVSYWRGTWLLLDYYAFPLSEDVLEPNAAPGLSNLEKTTWLCIGLGAGIVIGTSFASGPLQSLSKYRNKLKGFPSAAAGNIADYPVFCSSSIPVWLIELVERFLTYLLGFAAVCYWRGIWYFWDAYIISYNVELSAWISHCVGVFVLLVLFSLRSIMAPPAVFLYDSTLYSLLPIRHQLFSHFFLEKGDKTDSVKDASLQSTST